jgi:Bacterial antitoxin of type II TA system, VapB
MKKTLHIDETLLRDAEAASGAKTDTDTVRLGLEALVRRETYERLRALRGSEPRAHEIRRRRERSSRAKRSSHDRFGRYLGLAPFSFESMALRRRAPRALEP